jgi:hypothetical protein
VLLRRPLDQSRIEPRREEARRLLRRLEKPVEVGVSYLLVVTFVDPAVGSIECEGILDTEPVRVDEELERSLLRQPLVPRRR